MTTLQTCRLIAEHRAIEHRKCIAWQTLLRTSHAHRERSWTSCVTNRVHVAGNVHSANVAETLNHRARVTSATRSRRSRSHSQTHRTRCPGPDSPLPHLHQDWAHPSHICTRTGLTPPTSAPGLGAPDRAGERAARAVLTTRRVFEAAVGPDLTAPHLSSGAQHVACLSDTRASHLPWDEAGNAKQLMASGLREATHLQRRAHALDQRVVVLHVCKRVDVRNGRD
jgi:hypothetical protein